MPGNTDLKVIDGVKFIWVAGFNKHPGFWLSVSRKPVVVRVFPARTKKERWKVNKVIIGKTIDTYKDSAKKVWEKAAQWAKGAA